MNIALVDMTHHRLLDDARERLNKNPSADLSDIARELHLQVMNAEKKCRENILRTWFIGGLYNYDYEAARIALAKCIALDPAKQISQKEANKLLPVLWQSCRLLFKDDFSTLFDEIERVIQTNKAFEEDGINQPFV